jgi:hypothetical protein
MKQTVKEYRRRLERFNRWETEYNKAKSPARRLEEFLILFDLNFYAPAEVKTDAHRAHLDHLIDSQKRIIKAQELNPKSKINRKGTRHKAQGTKKNPGSKDR